MVSRQDSLSVEEGGLTVGKIGTIAYEMGVGWRENPYKRGTTKAMLWLYGWHEAKNDEEMAERDGAE
jgi:hypothetical protein